MIKIHQTAPSESTKVRVTFSMPAKACGDCLYLVGWFNEWDESVYRMERTEDDNWSVTLELERGCTYQYRFRTGNGQWLDDPSLPPPSGQLGLNRSFVVGREARP